MKGLSLFSSSGIGEMMLTDTNIEMAVSNELLPIRSKVHNFWIPNSKMICGDISLDNIKSKIIDESIKQKVDFILCTPPCQGVSLIGKNKTKEHFLEDERNYLIFHAIEIFSKINPSYIIIENVPRYLKLFLPYKGELLTIEEILRLRFGDKYNIDIAIYNATDFGVAQDRKRAIIKLYRKGLVWEEPVLVEDIQTTRDAIGHLPSIESGEKSHIKNHNARIHSKNHITCMRNTPTGKSAMENDVHYPKNSRTGEKVKAYSASYKRIEWDKPAPTITMRNDAISSQSNVHPGRLNSDGTYSDARVLSLRELFILSSIDPDIDVPDFASDSQIRHMIGEAVPPKMLYELVRMLK